jgi:curved DNA-binding protein
VNPEDLEDMLGGLGGIGDFLRGGGSVGSRARTGRSGRSAARAGNNIELETTVDFTTAAVGGVRSVTLRSGEDGKPTTFDVRIPPGVATGSSLRIAGRGSPGIGGGPAGDLVLRIQVAPHPHFRRDGLDILIDVPITIAEASLGTKVSVPLLKGTVDVRVPAGTSSGKRVRVPGKGIAPPNKSPGDFYAVIQIAAPPSLTEQDQSALREIGERLPNPREGLW